MKLIKHFSIGKRVSVGYIIIILLTSLCSVYSVLKLRESRNTDEKISEVFTTLLVKMDQMQIMISNSKKYINNWIYVPNDQEKEALKNIHTEQFPAIVKEIESLQAKWTRDNSLDSLNFMISRFAENISFQQEIMNQLNSLESYSNDSIIFYVAIPIFDEKVEVQINTLSSDLERFTIGLKKISNDLLAEKNASLDRVENITILLTVLSIVLAAIASLIVTSSITKPIGLLNENIQKMRLGELPKFDFETGSDEIGDMAKSLDDLRINLEKTSNFAMNIGHGMLEMEYEVLSEEDVLGKSLLTMRNNLIKVISETNDVITRAGENGDLSARIDVEHKSGAWRELSESINNLLLSVATPILSINRIINAMADGDLTERSQDRVEGDFKVLTGNLNKALLNLNEFLSQISDNAVSINGSTNEMQVSGLEMASSTGEIATAIGQMSNGAQTQVGKVDESSQLIEGILKSSNEMGHKAEKINEAAKAGVKNSTEGTQMVERVVTNMNEIAEYSNKTNESIHVLTDRSNQITRMLAVISDIASQTNLLALNAAIEAAQAGDAGRGFAVVAEEIRKLAESSKSSAKEIEHLVMSVQNDTQEATKAIEVMHKSVVAGNETSQQVSRAFRKIMEASNNTLESSEEILGATKVQISDINEVVNITENIVVIAEQTASGTGEVATSASELSSGMDNYNHKTLELSKIAKKLQKGVERFTLSTEDISKHSQNQEEHDGARRLRVG